MQCKGQRRGHFLWERSSSKARVRRRQVGSELARFARTGTIAVAMVATNSNKYMLRVRRRSRRRFAPSFYGGAWRPRPSTFDAKQ
jgi:hypothetical protein